MGFEVVVRPSVSPRISPAAARALSPADVSDQSFAVIAGSGGKLIDLTYSESRSSSHNKQKEKQRRVDETRIYKKDDDGEVDKDTFIDVDIVNKIWYGDGGDVTYAPVQEDDNIEVRRKNVIK